MKTLVIRKDGFPMINAMADWTPAEIWEYIASSFEEARPINIGRLFETVQQALYNLVAIDVIPRELGAKMLKHLRIYAERHNKSVSRMFFELGRYDLEAACARELAKIAMEEKV